ncbi:unnamed protein product [Prorocentrum cordatum]|uniref:Uncharacterized protein n=1 Tax=Prorocentrum cordatum TaxID=2364126 RepID=A0ABN9PWK3_9DINO|nr:unnamed protein product [Polarella glacialis]
MAARVEVKRLLQQATDLTMAELDAFMDAGMDEPVKKILMGYQGDFVRRSRVRRPSLSASTEDPGSDGILSNAFSDLSFIDQSFPLKETAGTENVASTQTVNKAIDTHFLDLDAAVSQAFDSREGDEQAKLDMDMAEKLARWQGRRQQKIQKRTQWKHNFNSLNGEHKLGFCSSDCVRCKEATEK